MVKLDLAVIGSSSYFITCSSTKPRDVLAGSSFRNKGEQIMENPNDSIAHAPLPTEKTLRFRKNLVIQLWRFVAINIKMLNMIRKGHHQKG